MSDLEIKNAADLLADLRWSADRVIMNHFGERVWLTECASGRGITDCCLAAEPCDYHAKLTNAAPGGIQ